MGHLRLGNAQVDSLCRSLTRVSGGSRVEIAASDALSRGMDAHETTPLLLTIPEAAAKLRIGRSTLCELIADRQVDVVHIGRAVRVTAAELERFVADRCRRGSVR